MKKKLKYIVYFVVFCLFISLSTPVRNFLDEANANKKIEDDKPSQREIMEFQELLKDDTYYYYNNLSDTDKEAYQTMYISLMKFEDSFYLELSKDNLKDVFMAVLYDNPHIFWVKNNYTYKEYDDAIMFCPEYRHTAGEAEKITSRLNKKIDDIVTSVASLSSEYEKELYIHDFVCANTEYDETSGDYSDTAYEAILNGKAICEGYSRAIQILLNAVDIDNYLIVGNGITDGESEPHMWNVVNIDNANYHLDATWNDTTATDAISYFYFNVTDEYILQDHTDLNIVNNGCIYDGSNYFVMENAKVTSYNGFYEHVNRSASTLKNGSNSIEFYFVNSKDFNRALGDLEKDNNFFKFIASAVYQSGRNLNYEELEYYTMDDYNYLCIVLKER